MNKLNVLLMVPVTAFMERVPRFPDLGIGYLANAIKKAGHKVSLLSWNMKLSGSDFNRFLIENKFDVIGIKVFTNNLTAANKTIKIIRSKLPETIIVVGGPHPSSSEPEDIIIDFEDCDFAIRGEAEIGLPNLLDYVFEYKKKYSDEIKKIPGLVWKSDGNVYSNSPLFIAEIDSFGIPAWEMMQPKDYGSPRIPGGPKYGYSAPIIVTRGCSSRCKYCAAYKINGKKARIRDPKSVLEELSLL